MILEQPIFLLQQLRIAFPMTLIPENIGFGFVRDAFPSR